MSFLVCLHKPCDAGKSKLDLLSLDDDVDMKDNKVELNDNLIVEMRPPLVYELEGKDDAEIIKPLMRTCMVRIYDEEEIYEMNDHRDSEIDEFIESLSLEQFDKISNFFASPSITTQVESWTCEKCGNENNVVLKGLQSFFSNPFV